MADVVMCACGCGVPLLTKRHPLRKFISEQHAFEFRKKKNVVHEPCVCACGCLETFIPSSTRNRFKNQAHRESHYALKQIELTARKKSERMASHRVRGSNTVKWYSTDAEKSRNQESIDRIVGKFLAGDVEAIRLKPGAGTLRGVIKDEE